MQMHLLITQLLAYLSTDSRSLDVVRQVISCRQAISRVSSGSGIADIAHRLHTRRSPFGMQAAYCKRMLAGVLAAGDVGMMNTLLCHVQQMLRYMR